MTGVTVVTIFSPIITPSLIPDCYKNPDNCLTIHISDPPARREELVKTILSRAFYSDKMTLVQMTTRRPPHSVQIVSVWSSK